MAEEQSTIQTLCQMSDIFTWAELRVQMMFIPCPFTAIPVYQVLTYLILSHNVCVCLLTQKIISDIVPHPILNAHLVQDNAPAVILQRIHLTLLVLSH